MHKWSMFINWLKEKFGIIDSDLDSEYGAQSKLNLPEELDTP